MDESQVVHVAPAGEIDVQTSEEFAAELGKAVATAAEHIDLSLANVSFLDSNGIRVIVECANKAKENGTVIHVRDAQGEVQRVLEISGILGSVIFETPI